MSSIIACRALCKTYSGLALVHMDDAAKLYRMNDKITGLRIKLDDPFLTSEVAPAIAAKLSRDRKSTRLNSSHERRSRMPSSA